MKPPSAETLGCAAKRFQRTRKSAGRFSGRRRAVMMTIEYSKAADEAEVSK
jgi:hypothetical protein